MKANPLTSAFLLLLAVAVQLFAHNTNTTNAPKWEDTKPGEVKRSEDEAAAIKRRLDWIRNAVGTNASPKVIQEISALDAENFVKTKAQAEKGNAEAQRELGAMFENGKGVQVDTKEAEKWYRKAAEQGNIYAQEHLGWAYVQGDKKDVNELVMYADNLGSIPPNTALMVVTDGDSRYEVRISSDLQRSGVIRFIHKPKPGQ